MSLELQSLLPYPNSCLGASPHQQGRDTKMEMLSFGGIDVSKDRLDITVLPDEQCSSVSNDAAGWAELRVNPVTLPPGRAKFGTMPSATGSATCTNTIGTERVAWATAMAAGPPQATIMSG